MARKSFNIISTIILVVLIIIVIAVFYIRITGGVPEIFGYQVYRVSSGSMSPVLEVGDVILSHKVDADDIHVGDIVTYLGDEGEYRDMLITHSVITAPHKAADGDLILGTQGVAEGATPDPEISISQVKGKFVARLTFLNDVYTFFLSPYGLIVFILIIMVLFGYEIITLILSYKRVEQADIVDMEIAENAQGKKKKKTVKKNKHR